MYFVSMNKMSQIVAYHTVFYSSRPGSDNQHASVVYTAVPQLLNNQLEYNTSISKAQIVGSLPVLETQNYS